jgi:hypothetical protein
LSSGWPVMRHVRRHRLCVRRRVAVQQTIAVVHAVVPCRLIGQPFEPHVAVEAWRVAHGDGDARARHRFVFGHLGGRQLEDTVAGEAAPERRIEVEDERTGPLLHHQQL